MKEAKNNVSYFFAGYKAALEKYKVMTREEIKKTEYTTTEFHNQILEAYNKYQDE